MHREILMSEESHSESSEATGPWAYVSMMCAISVAIIYFTNEIENILLFFITMALANWFWTCVIASLDKIIRKDSIFYYMFSGPYELIKRQMDKFMDWEHAGLLFLLLLIASYWPSRTWLTLHISAYLVISGSLHR